MIPLPPRRTAPAFRPHASGLLVPEEHSRAREVWTKDEFKTVKRAIAFLESKGLTFLLACPAEGCRSGPVSITRRVDGGFTLECEHKTREVQAR